MAKRQQIDVEIDAQGNLSAEVIGGDGVTCIEQLNKILGNVGKKQKEEKKAEFYQRTKKTGVPAFRKTGGC